MKTPPADLDPDLIAVAIEAQWGKRVDALAYAPLGFGSHHWLAETVEGERWFVTVDDLRAEHLSPREDASFERLETAFGIAAHLRNEFGLSFVVAPIATRTGRSLHRLTDRYSLALFPRLDVVPRDFGTFADEDDRIGALGLVGRVHAASDDMPLLTLRSDTLAIPGRESFEATLHDTGTSWTGGPYAEPARELLRGHVDDVRAALGRFDALVREVTADQSGWVITHGEPHAANVIRTTAGDQVIVDWDTVALAPPERDLWMLVDEEDHDWSAYSDITGLTMLSAAAMEAYRRHWALSEIAIYLAWSRAPHEDTEEMRIAWKELRSYLESLGSW